MTTAAQPFPPLVAGNERTARKTPNLTRLRQILAHPLVLLIVGAWISGLMIPRITQGWQDRQKALEIRTELVSAMSEDATTMLTSIQEVRRHPRATLNRDEFSREFTQWTAKSAVTLAKVQAYFPNTTLQRDWGNLSGAIGHFYQLQVATFDGASDGVRADLEKKISGRLADILGPTAVAAWKPANPSRWWSIRDTILAARGELVRRVLLSGPVALR
jgi:hypothetical protein